MQNIDGLHCNIEKDSTLSNQGKVKYLRGLEFLLSFFTNNTISRKLSPLILPEILTAYEKCIQYDKKGLSIEKIVRNLCYESSYALIKADNSTFEKNPGFKASNEYVILKYCQLYPDKTFSTLSANPDIPFADSLVRAVSRLYPKQLYDYAQASNKLGMIIRNIQDDKFIVTVVKMARSKDGQQYFSFLDNVLNGRLTMEEIDEAKKDSIQYYRLLVKTRIDYVKRALDKDTAY